ncbi:extracellular solute-binding protein [Anaerocolumna sp. MB42-C2]|uniref:extracellular solute-binding protein n=1 Tax=Anaerocolumna sp. MB42-C2 TaxID=3070997 RepID=UPI0027DFC49B|nr:extracellular solute-binding protein [Anaerocolumna sp. MB42-C2]WMJ86886.1 extracellular solute-binding protein [Anaerocolumna sp. MB42-C2]
MKKRKLRISALLLTVVLTMSMLAGCKSNSETKVSNTTDETVSAESTSDNGTTDNGASKTTEQSNVQQDIDWEKIGWQADPADLEWKKDTSPIKLSYYVNFSWFGLNWDDETARRVTEKTGVDLELTKPVSDDGQKLNMMIAGDQLPDIMTIDRNDPALQKMIDAGLVWSLDDLIDQYAPKMRDVLPKEILQNYRSKDGKTYRFTTWVQGEAWQKAAREYDQMVGTNQPVMSVRKDYYEEIGSPEIKTQKDFISALEKMHANHPDKIAFYPADNAVSASTLALNASMGNLGVQFGMSNNMTDQGGQIRWQARSQEFQNTIGFLHELQTKGLLNQDPFIDSKDVNNAKITRGDVISYTWVISDGEKVPGDNPDTQYTIVGPLDTYKQIRTGAGWLATVISKKCANPDRAIRFLEYMSSVEGHQDVSWGVQGDTYSGDVVKGPQWHLVDGKPTMLPDYVKDKNADWSGVAAKNGLGEYWIACNEMLWNLPWWDTSNEKMANFNKVYGPKVVYVPELDFQSPDPASDEGIILQKAHELLQLEVPAMVFAEDWKAEYTKFIAQIDELGMDRVESFYNTQYQEKLKSMK